MLIPKRIITKLAPVLGCTAIVIFIMIQNRPQEESNLLSTLEELHKVQSIHIQRMMLEQQKTVSTNSEEQTNKTKPVKLKTVLDVRPWFDNRSAANSSKMLPSNHPLFPGFVIENPHICSTGPVDLLLYIHSATDHKDRRRHIRDSWGSIHFLTDVNIRLVFILGRPVDANAQLQIYSEYSAYGDIVQADFIDTFPNITYKAITFMTWANAHCVHARFVLKTDDDMFVDTYRVISELLPKIATKELAFVCDYKKGMRIFRSKNNRWYVNSQILPERKQWPPFCAGYFTLLTGTLIPILYERSFQFKDLIPVDDAYMFGILVEESVSVEFFNIHGTVSSLKRANPSEELKANGKFEYIAFHAISSEDNTLFWTLRSDKLSDWEQSQNYAVKMSRDYNQKVVLK